MAIRTIATEMIPHRAGVDAVRALVPLARLLRRAPEDDNAMNFARRLSLIAFLRTDSASEPRL
jgi:hypothetical protein